MSLPARMWAQVDAENPRVWELFVKFTFELIQRGFTHHSAYAVMHRVRWETAAAIMEPHPMGGEYKVSNQWISYYARKFHLTYPTHSEFFRTKTAMADAVMGTVPQVRAPRRVSRKRLIEEVMADDYPF